MSPGGKRVVRTVVETTFSDGSVQKEHSDQVSPVKKEKEKVEKVKKVPFGFKSVLRRSKKVNTE